jgi:Domain of Unknown Function (DUF908)
MSTDTNKDSIETPHKGLNTPHKTPKGETDTKRSSGLVTVEATIISGSSPCDVAALAKSLIERYDIPIDKQFELMHKLRIASYTGDSLDHLREIRLLAIAILCISNLTQQISSPKNKRSTKSSYSSPISS